MILHLHGEPLDGGIERRPFGNRPGKQHAIKFQTEIVMQLRGTVFLDHVLQRAFGKFRVARFFGRLRRNLEVALSAIFLEGHAFILHTWIVPGQIAVGLKAEPGLLVGTLSPFLRPSERPGFDAGGVRSSPKSMEWYEPSGYGLAVQMFNFYRVFSGEIHNFHYV